MCILVCAILLFPAHGARAQQLAVPKLTERFTDQTGTVDAARAGRIEARLARFEEETGSQVAVLLVATTYPEEIEQYSIRVVDQWALGRAEFDDGVLLLVAKDDRRLRIEVGQGLEGAIPDAKAKRIIEELIVPAFRAGEFVTGIETGIDAILGLIRGEDLPKPEPGARSPGGGTNVGALLPILMFMLFAGGFVRRLIGSLPGSLASGGLGFLGGWLIVGSLGIGLFLAVVGVLLSMMPAGRGLGGYYGGGMGGGYGGMGGGGFGGGFGGGGGGFSGGGASGGW